MTKELIEELREYATALRASVHVHHTGADLIERAADTLAARQPTEDDREAIAKALCEGADTCWNDLTEQELVWHYRDAESVLAAGFSRGPVPDAATDGDYHEGLEEGIKIGRAERDAALAAVERVRAIHGPSDEFPAGCDYCERLTPCSTRAALDGAPEPEVKP